MKKASIWTTLILLIGMLFPMLCLDGCGGGGSSDSRAADATSSVASGSNTNTGTNVPTGDASPSPGVPSSSPTVPGTTPTPVRGGSTGPSTLSGKIVDETNTGLSGADIKAQPVSTPTVKAGKLVYSPSASGAASLSTQTAADGSYDLAGFESDQYYAVSISRFDRKTLRTVLKFDPHDLDKSILLIAPKGTGLVEFAMPTRRRLQANTTGNVWDVGTSWDNSDNSGFTQYLLLLESDQAFTGNLTKGSNIITNVTMDTNNQGAPFAGMLVYHAQLPHTSIKEVNVAARTVRLSAPATSTATRTKIFVSHILDGGATGGAELKVTGDLTQGSDVVTNVDFNPTAAASPVPTPAVGSIVYNDGVPSTIVQSVVSSAGIVKQLVLNNAALDNSAPGDHFLGSAGNAGLAAKNLEALSAQTIHTYTDTTYSKINNYSPSPPPSVYRLYEKVFIPELGSFALIGSNEVVQSFPTVSTIARPAAQPSPADPNTITTGNAIVIKFNQPVDTDSVEKGLLITSHGDSDETLVWDSVANPTPSPTPPPPRATFSVKKDWSGDRTTLTVTPDQNFKYKLSRQITVTVQGGTDATYGNRLSTKAVTFTVNSGYSSGSNFVLASNSEVPKGFGSIATDFRGIVYVGSTSLGVGGYDSVNLYTFYPDSSQVLTTTPNASNETFKTANDSFNELVGWKPDGNTLKYITYRGGGIDCVDPYGRPFISGTNNSAFRVALNYTGRIGHPIVIRGSGDDGKINDLSGHVGNVYLENIDQSPTYPLHVEAVSLDPTKGYFDGLALGPPAPGSNSLSETCLVAAPKNGPAVAGDWVANQLYHSQSTMKPTDLAAGTGAGWYFMAAPTDMQQGFRTFQSGASRPDFKNTLLNFQNLLYPINGALDGPFNEITWWPVNGTPFQSSLGASAQAVGQPGRNTGQYRSLASIALDADAQWYTPALNSTGGYAYLGDAGNNRILVYMLTSHDGTTRAWDYAGTWGSVGSSSGYGKFQDGSIKKVLVDGNYYVYVIDGNNLVQKFAGSGASGGEPIGTFITQFTIDGNGYCIDQTKSNAASGVIYTVNGSQVVTKYAKDPNP